MLKLFAFILMLPLSAMASNDCQVSTVGTMTSVECADLVLTKELSPAIDQFHLEFADGFTLFFQANQDQQPDKFVVALGDRDEAVLTKKDHNQLAEATRLIAEAESNEGEVHAFLKGLPKNQPLQDVIQFGGEVPWPIVGCENTEAAKTEACKK